MTTPFDGMGCPIETKSEGELARASFTYEKYSGFRMDVNILQRVSNSIQAVQQTGGHS
jgi:hypothetical protein